MPTRCRLPTNNDWDRANGRVDATIAHENRGKSKRRRRPWQPRLRGGSAKGPAPPGMAGDNRHCPVVSPTTGVGRGWHRPCCRGQPLQAIGRPS